MAETLLNPMEPQPIDILWPAETWQNRVRAIAADLVISAECHAYRLLSLFTLFDELRWWIEGHLTGDLFGEWHHDSADELQMVINGEIPLEHLPDHLKRRIRPFGATLWECHRCQQSFHPMFTNNGRCPDCDNSGLYMTFPDTTQNRHFIELA